MWKFCEVRIQWEKNGCKFCRNGNFGLWGDFISNVKFKKKQEWNEWEFYLGALKAKYKRKLEEVKYFTLKDSLFYFYIKVISCLTFFQFTDNTIFLDVLKHIFTHHFSSITSAVLRHHFNFIQEKETKLTWSARSCHSVLEKLNENSQKNATKNLSFSREN